MVYDVHVHFRSEHMMRCLPALAERLDMVMRTNSINLEGSSSPNFPVCGATFSVVSSLWCSAYHRET